jgi:uncharacterized Ntn-hydrolase superfamily protein
MTYSIVARDPRTGELGVAVQSHAFSVGPIVPWAEAGVGAVATQAFADVSYGPLGLERMREGAWAADALAALVAADKNAARRQVAMVDATGAAAAHTGASCILHAGHRIGDGVSVQANMMERQTVPDAMLAAYESAQGTLAERLLTALDAAEAEGGDIRGRQSSSMVVVSGTRSDRPWAHRRIDLRVDDHPEPLAELRRLYALFAAHRKADEAQVAASNGDMATAGAKIAEAFQLAPGDPEIAFWAAIGAAAGGQLDVARSLLAQATAVEPRWRELARRLPAVDLFPLSEETLNALLAE